MKLSQSDLRIKSHNFTVKSLSAPKYPSLNPRLLQSGHSVKKLVSCLPSSTLYSQTFESSQKKRKRYYKKPSISSKSWIIYESNGRIIDSHNENEQREIASLTKIMTCIVAIEELQRCRRSLSEYISISENSCKVEGTKAGLCPKDSLKIFDLLHALMLPSGNDAALALAELIGKHQDPFNNPVLNFVSKMNALARSLKLESTSFSNPHGLSSSLNLSTVKNMATLTAYGLKIPLFSKIVNTSNYECQIYSQSEVRRAEWVNTNKLLWKGFSGVKTGFTPNAGPCLCTCSIDTAKVLIIILLKCKSMQARWGEAIKLLRWGNQEF